jgi:hypothetical protein
MSKARAPVSRAKAIVGLLGGVPDPVPPNYAQFAALLIQFVAVQQTNR